MSTHGYHEFQIPLSSLRHFLFCTTHDKLPMVPIGPSPKSMNVRLTPLSLASWIIALRPSRNSALGVPKAITFPSPLNMPVIG